MERPALSEVVRAALPAEVRAYIALLEGHVGALAAELAALRGRVENLEARLNQHSANSSRPPSSDPPGTPPRRSPPSGRSRGGQPGHRAHIRLLVPPERIDRVVEHYPAVCAPCRTPLRDDPAVVVGDPVCHQVTELPPVRAVVTEHHLYRVCCRACGGHTRATLPADVPAGAFGPRLPATVAVLCGRYRLSRREVVDLCDDLLGAPLALGSVDRLCQDTAAALAQPVAEATAAVRAAPVAHADETGWRQAGQRRWLWVVVTAVATVFTIAASRGSAVIKGLLGEDFAGRVVSDRWSAYSWLADGQRQLCWAHLTRDFQALVDRGGKARPLGQRALELIDDLFAAWHVARADPTRRATLADDLRPTQDAFRLLLDRGLDNPIADASGLCYQLLLHWDALWTFATVPGVDPTNNAAERAIRPAVLWRKGCLGTQSDAGNRFVARMLSVTATCKQHRRPLLAYVTDVCTAAQRGLPSPALLPLTS
jgi:transposase